MLQLRPVSASRRGVMVMFPYVSVNTSASAAKMKSRAATKSRQGVNSSEAPVKKPTLSPVFPLSWKTEGTKEPIGNSSTAQVNHLSEELEVANVRMHSTRWARRPSSGRHVNAERRTARISPDDTGAGY